MQLRHKILPVWYSLELACLLTAYGMMRTRPNLAVTIWLCALFLGALSLFVLEVIGAAIFSGALKGEEGFFLKKQLLRIRGDNAYSAAERFRLLGQAGFCWLICGLTVYSGGWFTTGITGRTR